MPRIDPHEIPLFLAWEPAGAVVFERLNAEFQLTNAGGAAYESRLAHPDPTAAPETLREAIDAQIRAARVTVVVISEDTRGHAWVQHEIRRSRELDPGRGLVAITLDEHALLPDVLENAGAIFIPFRRERVERAIRWAVEEPQTRGDYRLADD